MTSVTNDIKFIDQMGDCLYITDHENGAGISVSTSNRNKNEGKPISIVTLFPNDVIKLRDWLNSNYPQ